MKPDERTKFLKWDDDRVSENYIFEENHCHRTRICQNRQLQQNVHNVVELRVKWCEHPTCSKWR